MEGDGDGIDGEVRQRPSQAVVEAVASAEGISPDELRPPEYEPLHAVVDPDALDALFGSYADGRPRPGGTVAFEFCGYDVTVDGSGAVSIEERPPDE